MVSRIVGSACLVAQVFATSIVVRQANGTEPVTSMVTTKDYCAANTATCNTLDFCQLKLDETNVNVCDDIGTVTNAYNDALCINTTVEMDCDGSDLCKWSTSKGHCVGEDQNITIITNADATVSISDTGVAPQNGTYEHAPKYCRAVIAQEACDAVVGVCEWEKENECGTKKKTITATNQAVCTGLDNAACGADLRCEFGNVTEGCLGSEKMFLLPTAV